MLVDREQQRSLHLLSFLILWWCCGSLNSSNECASQPRKELGRLLPPGCLKFFFSSPSPHVHFAGRRCTMVSHLRAAPDMDVTTSSRTNEAAEFSDCSAWYGTPCCLFHFSKFSKNNCRLSLLSHSCELVKYYLDTSSGSGPQRAIPLPIGI
jgi:hypothetical protein